MVIKVNKKNKIKGIKGAKYLNHTHLTSGVISRYLASFFALIFCLPCGVLAKTQGWCSCQGSGEERGWQ